MAEPGKNAVITLESADNKPTPKTKPIVVNQKQLDEIKLEPSFKSQLMISPRSGQPFFYFRRHGQTLEGFLGHSFDCSFFNRGKSFQIDTDQGVEEFFAGRYLQKIFDKYELEGKYIVITYIGDQYTGYGHARKIYKVEKYPITDRKKITTQMEYKKFQKQRAKTSGSKSQGIPLRI